MPREFRIQKSTRSASTLCQQNQRQPTMANAKARDCCMYCCWARQQKQASTFCGQAAVCHFDALFHPIPKRMPDFFRRKPRCMSLSGGGGIVPHRRCLKTIGVMPRWSPTPLDAGGFNLVLPHFPQQHVDYLDPRGVVRGWPLRVKYAGSEAVRKAGVAVRRP